MIAKWVVVALAALAGASLATGHKDLLPVESGKSSDNFCQGCRSLVSFATFYNSTENRTQFRQLTNQFCLLQLAENDKAYCSWFTDSVFSILNRMDSVRHCDKLGVCSPPGSGSNDCKDSSCRTRNNEIPLSSEAENVVCEVCEQTIQQIKVALTNPQFETFIKQQAEAFCNYLVVVGEDKMCRHLVDNYLNQALEFLRTVQPSVYCKSIALCSANAKDSELAPVLASFKGFGVENKVFINNKLVKDISSVQHEPDQPGTAMVNCDICKTMVKEMFHFLKDNRTEESIRENLDKVCSLIYSKSTDKLKNCDEMVQTYSKQIIEMLIDETDPQLICTLLEQCTYKDNKSVRTKSEPQTVNMSEFVSMLDPSIQLESKRTCMECKLFIEFIQVKLADAKTEAEVKQWLAENLCNNLQPKSVKSTCTRLINTYSGLFFKAIIRELDPKTACIELNACNRSRFQILVIDAKPKTTANKSSTSPKLVASNNTKGYLHDRCVEIVRLMDDYISTFPVDHDVSVLVDQVCNKIPNKFAKNECMSFIQRFGQDIERDISTMDNPDLLCSKLMPLSSDE